MSLKQTPRVWELMAGKLMGEEEVKKAGYQEAKHGKEGV
jgi:hypothetical protein